MKIAPPLKEEDVRVEEPSEATVAGSRVATIVRALPYLPVVLVVSVPLMFAWGSFLVYYEKAQEAFGDGRVFDGVANLILVALLIVFVACLSLTFVLVSKSLGAAAWRWTEGRPTLRAGLSSARFGLTSVAVIATLVTLFTWLASDRAESESRTIKESLEEAGSRVATLLAPDGDTAQAATEESEPNDEYEDAGTSEPEELYGGSAAAPRRAEERNNATPLNGPASDARGTSVAHTVSPGSVYAIPDDPLFAFEEAFPEEAAVPSDGVIDVLVEPEVFPELTMPFLPPDDIPPAGTTTPETPYVVERGGPTVEDIPAENTSPEIPPDAPPEPRRIPGS